MPFFTEGFEGFDVNTPEDWMLAERFVERGERGCPTSARPYPDRMIDLRYVPRDEFSRVLALNLDAPRRPRSSPTCAASTRST